MSQAVIKPSQKMRSAVSAILSEPERLEQMAFPDYYQTSADHRRGLILVLPVGSRLNSNSFGRIRDRIINLTKVAVPAVVSLSPSVNARDSNDANVDVPPRQFRVRYTNSHPLENNDWGDFQMHRSLVGLVCVGGYSSPQELCELSRLHDVAKAKYSKSVLDTRLIAIGIEDEKKNGSDQLNFNGSNNDDLNLPPLETNQPSLNSNGSQTAATTTVLFYQSKDFEETLDADILDYITGLFWILESQRRDMQKSSTEKLPFYCAPFEKKDFVGLDLESRTNKKRTYGRYRKHMGDLCLLCDMSQDALTHYENAVETLRSCNDWIWLAGALEGLCSISVMVLYPNLNKRTVLPVRNESFDTFPSFKKKLSFDDTPLLLSSNKVLKASDIIDKYKECVVHYSKYRHAGVIETEASIKAVRVLTEQCNYLLAAEFLQNIVFINLQMNDEEKIQRFSALADLYEGIGFKRKAAFFLRVAAMRCVAPQNPHPDWSLCYSLLLKATSGYYLDLTRTVALKTEYIGWPDLQIQLLQEMVGTARRMGNHKVSTRHMTYLIEVLFDHLSDNEKADFSQQLNVLTSRVPGDDSPITLPGLGGLILPPVSMYKVPKVNSFSVCPLPSHLVPRIGKGHRKNKESVFVFTPLNFGGNEQKHKVNFQWVANDVSEVCLTLYNPLPIEVRLIGLALLHEGIEFENCPSTLSLAPNSGPHHVSLLGVPKEAGELKILGYKFQLLGVQSSCRLRGPKGQAVDYKITVLPSLPQLDATLKRIDTQNQEEDEMLKLYLGESATYECVLTNITNNIKAEHISVSVSTNPSDMKDLATLEEESSLENNVELELIPGESHAVKIVFKAMKLLFNNTFATSIMNDVADQSQDGGPSSISSVMSRQEPSRWSGKSASDSSRGNSVKRPSFVTVDVKITYSGGEGGTKGYFRELVRSVKVDICPSALVSKWDVLPAETLNENYLVLDISNQSIHEIEIEYGHQKKKLLMEPTDSCRIPVPIKKFPIQDNFQDTFKERQKSCLKYLEKYIHIEWTLPRLDNRNGVVSLREIKLDEEMISSLELCPLEWKLTLNGQDPSVSSNPQTVMLGQECILEMCVTNHFEFDVDGHFNVEVQMEDKQQQQEHQKLIIQSQPQSRIFRCCSQASMSHTSSLLPLVSGTYDVVCSCSIVQVMQTKDDGETTASGAAAVFQMISKWPKITVQITDFQ